MYHQYTLRHPQRDAIKDALQAAGIASMIYYPIPVHLQKLYATLPHRHGSLPQTEAAATQVLSLPMYPELTEAQTTRIAETVLKAISGVATTA